MILFTDYYPVAIVLVASSILGLLSGFVGALVVLSKKSLLGDMIAHATLPGIALVYLLTNSTYLPWIMVGGWLAAFFALWCELFITHHSKIPYDAVLGTILSTFFGIGLVFITQAQKSAHVHHISVLQKLIFGNAALLSSTDLWWMGVITSLVFLILFLWWRSLVFVMFDPLAAHLYGYPVLWIKALFMGISVIVILLGIQTMGAVLMGTLLVAPALGVRPWIRSVISLAIISGIFAAGAAAVGTLGSCCIDHLPTGPCIVIMLTVSSIMLIVAHWWHRVQL